MSDPFAPTSVERLAAALPPDGANPVGAAARGILVNRVKGSTPGHLSQMFGTGPSFKEVFFPALRYDPREADIQRVTRLDNDFWTALAVVSICQQIGLSTSDIRPQMLTLQIGAEIGERNAQIRRVATSWYTYALNAVDGDVRTALAAFPDEPSRVAARGHYLLGLTSDTWVNDKLVQLASGSWTNATWELYHHWTKLLALGTPVADIDAAIGTIQSKGLPIPSEVGPTAWRQWTRWFGADIGGSDLPDAVAAILKTKCSVPIGGKFPTCMPEAASYEFTANSQPGNPYRRPPSGSCFTAGTRIVMADGGLKPIEQVATGEKVATPTGAREVVLTSRPRRAGRPVYRFDGLDFGFMGTQPFLVFGGSSDDVPTYAAADAEALARAVPTLTQFGMRGLSAGTPVLAAYRDALLVSSETTGVVPFPPPSTTMHEPDGDDYVYDLVLALGEEGRSEFFAGDAETQLLVSSEIPRYLAAPDTAAVVLHILDQAAVPILQRMEHVPDDGFADLLSIGIDAAARTVLPRLLQAQLTPEAAGLESDPPGLTEAINQLSATLGRDGQYDNRMSTLIEQFIPRFAPQLQAAIHMGWRSFSLATQGEATVLAVTIYAVEIFAEAGRLQASDIDIVVTLSTRGSQWVRTVEVDPAASSDHSYFTSDRVAYFAEWRPVLEPMAESARTEDTWNLRISLRRRSSGEKPSVRAVMVLPGEVSYGYQAVNMPLRNDDALVVGQVAFDVRALGSNGLREDIDQRAAWNPSQQSAMAARLASGVADALPVAFDIALAAFHSVAATPDGQQAGAALEASARTLATSTSPRKHN